MNVTLPAKISISRYHSSDGTEGINLYIRDETSGCEVVDLDMTLEDFGRVVTGLGHQPCTVEWRTDNLGKKHEHKQEVVPVPKDFPYRGQKGRESAEAEALKPFEVDGWHGSRDDLGNMHRRQGDGYSVTFHRYVEALT